MFIGVTCKDLATNSTTTVPTILSTLPSTASVSLAGLQAAINYVPEASVNATDTAARCGSVASVAVASVASMAVASAGLRSVNATVASMAVAASVRYQCVTITCRNMRSASVSAAP